MERLHSFLGLSHRRIFLHSFSYVCIGWNLPRSTAQKSKTYILDLFLILKTAHWPLSVPLGSADNEQRGGRGDMGDDLPLRAAYWPLSLLLGIAEN
eukprot:4877765-Pleurochrysis_carterae.AAC.4